MSYCHFEENFNIPTFAVNQDHFFVRHIQIRREQRQPIFLISAITDKDHFRFDIHAFFILSQRHDDGGQDIALPRFLRTVLYKAFNVNFFSL